MIIEHRTFALASDASEAALLELDRVAQTEVVPFLAGFVRRTTARSADGAWLVETLWYDEGSADAAGDGTVGGFDALWEPRSVHVARWTTLD